MTRVLTKFLRILFSGAAIGLLSLLPASAQDNSSPNLFTNPGFNRGIQSWRLEQIAPAAATLEVLSPNASPPKLDGRAVRINVTELGAENWHAQFFQTGLDLFEAEPYTLAFWARADRPRQISLNANVDVGDGHGIGLTIDGISITSGWRKYAYGFSATRVVKDHCRITFILGNQKGPVSLAGMTLRHGKTTVPVGPNLIRDGRFETPGPNWSFERKPPADGTFETQSRSFAPPGVASMVAHFQINDPGQENWHVQVLQSAVDLAQGETYSLTFWGKADRSRSLTVVASYDALDWHRIAPDSKLNLTPEWKKHSLLFTAAHTVAKHSRIVFLLGDNTGMVDLADVVLRHEVLRELAGSLSTRVLTERDQHPLVGTWESLSGGASGKLTFTFNADGTGSIRNESDSGVIGFPRSRVASAFRWFVKSQESRQVTIGNATYKWSLSESADRLTLLDSAGKTHTLFRRDERDKATAHG